MAHRVPCIALPLFLIQEINMQQTLFKVRDRRNKGWFYLDNEYLNGLGKHLGPIGISVYVALCRHADDEQKCFPSQELIAEEIGAGVRSVRNYLKKLEKHNIIRLEKVRTSDGRWLNNTYYLVDKTEWRYPQATDAYGKPRAIDDLAIGNRRPSHRHVVPIKDTNNNNTNKKKTQNSSFKKSKPFYKAEEGLLEMRKAQGKWWCLPSDGSKPWLEFSTSEDKIEWR